jgi:hypothetical protein
MLNGKYLSFELPKMEKFYQIAHNFYNRLDLRNQRKKKNKQKLKELVNSIETMHTDLEKNFHLLDFIKEEMKTFPFKEKESSVVNINEHNQDEEKPSPNNSEIQTFPQESKKDN